MKLLVQGSIVLSPPRVGMHSGLYVKKSILKLFFEAFIIDVMCRPCATVGDWYVANRNITGSVFWSFKWHSSAADYATFHLYMFEHKESLPVETRFILTQVERGRINPTVSVPLSWMKVKSLRCRFAIPYAVRSMRNTDLQVVVFV